MGPRAGRPAAVAGDSAGAGAPASTAAAGQPARLCWLACRRSAISLAGPLLGARLRAPGAGRQRDWGGNASSEGLVLALKIGSGFEARLRLPVAAAAKVQGAREKRCSRPPSALQTMQRCRRPTCSAAAAASAAHSSASLAKPMAQTGLRFQACKVRRGREVWPGTCTSAPEASCRRRRRTSFCKRSPAISALACWLARCRDMPKSSAHLRQTLAGLTGPL